MSYQLFIDDERLPSEATQWIVARSMQDVIFELENRGPPDAISFDHDLGDTVPTGHDIAKFLVEEDMELRNVGANRTGFLFKPVFRYWVHSQNPVGARNIRGLLDSYLGFICPK